MTHAKILLSLILLSQSLLQAQPTPPLVEQLNALWIQKDYTALRTLLDSKSDATPPDIVALICSKSFYLFVQPNRTKALAAMAKLKAAAEAKNNALLADVATAELSQIQAIPEVELATRTPEQLSALHTIFKDKFPMVEFAKQAATSQSQP